MGGHRNQIQLHYGEAQNDERQRLLQISSLAEIFEAQPFTEEDEVAALQPMFDVFDLILQNIPVPEITEDSLKNFLSGAWEPLDDEDTTFVTKMREEFGIQQKTHENDLADIVTEVHRRTTFSTHDFTAKAFIGIIQAERVPDGNDIYTILVAHIDEYLKAYFAVQDSILSSSIIEILGLRPIVLEIHSQLAEEIRQIREENE